MCGIGGVHGGSGMHGEGGVHGEWGACVAEETTTAASGTQPTGMHSCFLLIPGVKHNFFQFYSINVYRVGRSDIMRFKTETSNKRLIVTSRASPSSSRNIT